MNKYIWREDIGLLKSIYLEGVSYPSMSDFEMWLDEIYENDEIQHDEWNEAA